MSDLILSYNRMTRKFPTYIEMEFFPDGNIFLSPLLNVNGSVTPVDAWAPLEAYFDAPTKSPQFFMMMSFGVRMNAATNPVRADYGAIGGGLATGTELWVETDTLGRLTLAQFTNNQELANYFGNFNSKSFAASVDVHFTNDRPISGFPPVALADNPHVGVTINDNLTTMVNHRWFVQGLLIDNPEKWTLTHCSR